MAEFKYQIDGLEQVKTRLKGMKASMQKRVLRPALGKGARVVAKAAKSLVPVDTGLLKKALASKVFSKRNVVALIGARTGFEKVIGGKKMDPVRTAHFADTGRKEVVMRNRPLAFMVEGRFIRTSKVRAYTGSQFLSRAYNLTRAEVATIVAQDAAERLAKFGR